MKKEEALAAIDQKRKDNADNPKILAQLKAMADFLEIKDSVDYVVEKLKDL